MKIINDSHNKTINLKLIFNFINKLSHIKMNNTININNYPTYVIDSRISEHFKLDNLKQVMKDKQMIIAGGFVLRALVHFEVDENHDIDFLVESNNELPIVYYLKSNNWTEIKHNNNYYKNTTFSRVYTFKKNNFKVNLVITVGNPIEHVKKFDITACQVYYNGSEIVAFYPEHIRTRKLVSSHPINVERCRKYLERKFVF